MGNRNGDLIHGWMMSRWRPSWTALSALQRDCGAAHLGLSVFRTDRDRLLVALRHQIQISTERLPFCDNPEAGTFDLTGQGPRCIAGRLAPGSRDRVPRVRRAGAQVEIITVAGTVEVELKLVLRIENIIGRAALDRLVPAVGEIDRPRPGPGARQLPERIIAWRRTDSGLALSAGITDKK